MPLVTWRGIAGSLAACYCVSLALWVVHTAVHLEQAAQSLHRATWRFSFLHPGAAGNASSQGPQTPRKPKFAPTNPVLYMNNYIPENYVNSQGDLRKAMETSSGNVGNFVWMYGASILFGSPTAHEFIYSAYGDPNLPIYNARAFFFPIANIFQNASVLHRPGAESVNTTVYNTLDAIMSVDGPTLLVGAGTQGFYRDNKFFDLEPQVPVTDVSKYRLEKPHLDLLAGIKKRNGFIMARGVYSATVFRAHGFDRVAVAGCPTLFMNPEPGMGVELKARLVRLEKRVRQRGYVRILVTLPPYFKPKLSRLLLTLVLMDRDNRLIIQDNRDMATLSQAVALNPGLKVPAEQMAWFASVAAWREFSERFDFMVSGRIHGMMVALAGLVPGYVIAPDWRVKELVQTMMIPHADPFQTWLHKLPDLNANSILLTLVSKAESEFNGVEFDHNRCKIYRMYENIFDEMKLEINPRLAQICTSLGALASPLG